MVRPSPTFDGESSLLRMTKENIKADLQNHRFMTWGIKNWNNFDFFFSPLWRRCCDSSASAPRSCLRGPAGPPGPPPRWSWSCPEGACPGCWPRAQPAGPVAPAWAAAPEATCRGRCPAAWCRPWTASGSRRLPTTDESAPSPVRALNRQKRKRCVRSVKQLQLSRKLVF